MAVDEIIFSHDHKIFLVPPQGFPPEIISYCIWLYNSFSLRYRDVEKMMGIVKLNRLKNNQLPSA